MCTSEDFFAYFSSFTAFYNLKFVIYWYPGLVTYVIFTLKQLWDNCVSSKFNTIDGIRFDITELLPISISVPGIFQIQVFG